MKEIILLFLLLSVLEKSCARFIEGDILVRSAMDDDSNQDISGGVRLADPSRLWPGGFVFYRFDRTFQNQNSQKKVQNMMTYIESKFDGCITFEEDQKRNDFVLITADGGGQGSGTKCFSELGRVGGKQILNLDASCLRNHTIVHELVHTLGFSHEHNRPDRNLFVTVVTENILDGRKSDFTKRERGNSEWFEPGDVDTQNTPFDFQSVLLYPPSLSNSKSISKNGKQTLKYNAPLISSWPNFPPDEEPLTIIDMVEIALAYTCPLDQQTLIQYIHYNRLSSSQKMSVMETELKNLKQIVLDLSNEIKGNCPDNWTRNDQHCYRLFDDGRTWTEAQSFCQLMGGNLASIVSEKENQFVQDQFVKNRHIWIGGSDKLTEGNWTWSDGSAWTFDDWNSGQPDDYKAGQDCLLFNKKMKNKWDDGSCTYKGPFICKK